MLPILKDGKSIDFLNSPFFLLSVLILIVLFAIMIISMAFGHQSYFGLIVFQILILFMILNRYGNLNYNFQIKIHDSMSSFIYVLDQCQF